MQMATRVPTPVGFVKAFVARPSVETRALEGGSDRSNPKVAIYSHTKLAIDTYYVDKDVCTHFLKNPLLAAILLRERVMAISRREFEQKPRDRMF